MLNLNKLNKSLDYFHGRSNKFSEIELSEVFYSDPFSDTALTLNFNKTKEANSVKFIYKSNGHTLESDPVELTEFTEYDFRNSLFDLYTTAFELNFAGKTISVNTIFYLFDTVHRHLDGQADEETDSIDALLKFYDTFGDLNDK